MPDIEIYNNDKEALFQGVRLIIFSGLSLVLNKEKDCDFKRHLSWVGYTPLVEVNQAILAWSYYIKLDARLLLPIESAASSKIALIGAPEQIPKTC